MAFSIQKEIIWILLFISIIKISNNNIHLKFNWSDIIFCFVYYNIESTSQVNYLSYDYDNEVDDNLILAFEIDECMQNAFKR